jgi:hypothetical protein
MNTYTEIHQLNTNLTLRDSSQSDITIHALTLTLTQQNDKLIESRLVFEVNLELYQHIGANALFNLKPELRGFLTGGEFQSEPNIEITASLKPDLLQDFTDVPTYFKNLNQEQSDNPLLSTESWLALQVKQLETGYRTFWDYLSPLAMNADSIDNEKVNDAITNFFKDWAEVNLQTMNTDAISQAFEEVTKGFEEWVDTILSNFNEENIAQVIESMGKAFEEIAESSSSAMNQKPHYNRNILSTIINFFTEDDWSFTKIQGEPILQMAFQGNNGQWNCYTKVRTEQAQFVFYSICPLIVPKPKFLEIAEFITRANNGTIIGNFELDLDSGEIRYKTSIDVEDSTLSFAQIKRLVYTNVTMMDEYLPGIIAVIDGGVEAESAIAQIESIESIV